MRNTSIARSVKALVEANASHNVYTNGITAINLPANGAAARITVALNAGARNETGDNVGAASFTRNCLGASNYRNTGFLQNKMVNLMGGSFTTAGTREKTLINLVAGPKAIEELAFDVVLPAIQQPVFLKWEMTSAWDQAKNQGECALAEAFHAASFKGGLSNALAFKGGYGDENPYYHSEREEALEVLARNFHQANYGIEGATVVGCGVSEAVLEKFVSALQNTPYGNEAPSADGFRAGEVRVRALGATRAVVGVDVTGSDAAAAAVVAASVGGNIVSYSDVSVLQIPASSAAELHSKLESLSAVNFASAQATAALAQALTINSGDAAAVSAVAQGISISDVAGADQDSVQSLASSLATAPKSLAVIGDTQSFPHNTDL